VWVANFGGGHGNSVTELDGSTGALIQVLTGSTYGFNRPDGVSSNGSRVWVTSGGTGSNPVGGAREFAWLSVQVG
jgi:hypothetical protein